MQRNLCRDRPETLARLDRFSALSDCSLSTWSHKHHRWLQSHSQLCSHRVIVCDIRSSIAESNSSCPPSRGSPGVLEGYSRSTQGVLKMACVRKSPIGFFMSTRPNEYLRSIAATSSSSCDQSTDLLRRTTLNTIHRQSRLCTAAVGSSVATGNRTV